MTFTQNRILQELLFFFILLVTGKKSHLSQNQIKSSTICIFFLLISIISLHNALFLFCNLYKHTQNNNYFILFFLFFQFFIFISNSKGEITKFYQNFLVLDAKKETAQVFFSKDDDDEDDQKKKEVNAANEE